MNIEKILLLQKEYFQNGNTLSISFRKKKLHELYKTIKKNKEKIVKALKDDLGKSEFESYMCEIGMVYSEITYMLKNIDKLASKRKVRTPLAQFKSKSYELAVPYGNVLIMSPWNYPFLLTIGPLVDAVSAGNTVILKPSAYSPNSSKVIVEVIKEVFDEKHVCVVTGGREENKLLLDQKYDFIFFTGSEAVGRIVLEKASKNLTPVVLELGGKSTCIVDSSAKISLAAKRIVFGKFINCGQTCVAPDYILCDAKIKDDLIEALCNEIKNQYGEIVLENRDYGKIINEKHFDRLCELMDRYKVIYGGNINKKSLRIVPTLMDNVTFEDKIMQEEIFGPILPVLTYENFDEVYDVLKDKPKPLALYLISENKKNIDLFNKKIIYGGGCINDTIIHLATTEMGFGGVGACGMGSYHGKRGFDSFSHIKSIVEKSTKIDLGMRYQPYKKKNRKLVEKFLK